MSRAYRRRHSDTIAAILDVGQIGTAADRWVWMYRKRNPWALDVGGYRRRQWRTRADVGGRRYGRNEHLLCIGIQGRLRFERQGRRAQLP